MNKFDNGFIVVTTKVVYIYDFLQRNVCIRFMSQRRVGFWIVVVGSRKCDTGLWARLSLCGASTLGFRLVDLCSSPLTHIVFLAQLFGENFVIALDTGSGSIMIKAFVVNIGRLMTISTVVHRWKLFFTIMCSTNLTTV